MALHCKLAILLRAVFRTVVLNSISTATYFGTLHLNAVFLMTANIPSWQKSKNNDGVRLK